MRLREPKVRYHTEGHVQLTNAFCSVIEPDGETFALRNQRDVVKALNLIPQALDGESYHVSVLVDRHPVRPLSLGPSIYS